MICNYLKINVFKKLTSDLNYFFASANTLQSVFFCLRFKNSYKWGIAGNI